MAVVLTIILGFFAISSLNGTSVLDLPRKDPAVADFSSLDKYPSIPPETTGSSVAAEIDGMPNNERRSSSNALTVIVEPRDNLAVIFQREGISA